MFHFEEFDISLGAVITSIKLFTLRKPPNSYEIGIQVFKTQRTFYLVWVFVHFKLYDSKQRDPCEIAQTHMLSWAFSDHICRKYQQAIYEIPWYQFLGGTAQVDFMFGFDCKQNKVSF